MKIVNIVSGKMKKDRLFVPLNDEAFYWFRNNNKNFELRGYFNGWREKYVYSGREIELRRGYNTKDKIFGKIGKVVIGSMNNIFDKVNYKKIIPIAKSRQESIKKAKEILNKKKQHKKYIAFEVKL